MLLLKRVLEHNFERLQRKIDNMKLNFLTIIHIYVNVVTNYIWSASDISR